MKKIINNHNKNIHAKKLSENVSTCNCRNKEACPLNGRSSLRGYSFKQPTKLKRKKVF